MKYIAIGDIHGRYDLLMELLEKIDKDYPTHQKVFLGDMVDRGPDAYLVVKKIKELNEKHGAIALLGNHEDFMLDFYRRRLYDRYDIWLYPGNGGARTIESYGKAMKMYGGGYFFKALEKSGHISWLKNLPLFFETDEVWFSHAPVPKRQWREKDDFRTDREALTWSYHGKAGVSEEAYAEDHNKVAVCGHIHAIGEGVFVPRVYPNIVYTDTGSGCWPYAPLTATIIEDGKYIGYIQAIPKRPESEKRTIEELWQKVAGE